MIHVVTSENRHLYGAPPWGGPWGGDTGWVDLESLGEGGFGGAVEDDDEAVDLLGFDARMRPEARLRLRPTHARGRLADGFPQLVASGETPKKGPGVWEATGLFVADACRNRGAAAEGVRVSELWTAAMELALANGVDRLVGAIDMRFYPAVVNDPLDTRLVGLPQRCAAGLVVGVEIATSRLQLDRLRESIGAEGPVGYHVDALDLLAFGDLAAVQRQVIRAQIPQTAPGSARDEALAAETLYRLNDAQDGSEGIWMDRDTTAGFGR